MGKGGNLGDTPKPPARGSAPCNPAMGKGGNLADTPKSPARGSAPCNPAMGKGGNLADTPAHPLSVGTRSMSTRRQGALPLATPRLWDAGWADTIGAHGHLLLPWAGGHRV